ncbi:hypothetical protein SAMN04489867_1833 [Pedococcus dokdonensis]|uniref:TadE-like protein n=1 Tax=Pedococcus dokdonensis TaxID=443156 RepID=A0A1H0R3W5_9MICO|nr:pilus assembly protein [Pedococcus dokdonensis]SDP24177.1 hypothetical protein SAMN04489867_1833 [Pedococcus dokdonensis]
MTARTRRRLFSRLRGRASGDAGSAVVELVFLTVLVMVPLFYLTMTVSRVQAGAYAASAAAREAARVYVSSDDDGEAEERAEAAARLAFEDQGFGTADSKVVVVCDGAPCLRPEGRVEATATVAVPLPLVPSFARRVVPLAIPVSSHHLLVVDRFRAAR